MIANFSEPQSATTNRTPSTTMRILLVDDAEAFRQTFAEALRAQGHEVLEAADGLDGIKLARAHRPDVVVSDIKMARLDGYAMTSVLRQHPDTVDLPLVLMTGESDLKGMRKGMSLGADDYITKPFTIEEFEAAIQQRVQRRRAARAAVEKHLAGFGTRLSFNLPMELASRFDAILTTSRTLAGGDAPPAREQLAQVSQTIVAGTLEVERIVGNMFLLAQLEIVAMNPAQAGALRQTHIAAQPVVLAQARQNAAIASRERDLVLNLSECSAAIGSACLAKLVEELAGNALRFSVPGSPVKVSCYDDGHDFLLTIADHGCGMTPEKVAALGSVQPSGNGPSGPRATGLGLSIARRLVELHGGRLVLTSEPAKGTTVRVSLPAPPRRQLKR